MEHLALVNLVQDFCGFLPVAVNSISKMWQLSGSIWCILGGGSCELETNYHMHRPAILHRFDAWKERISSPKWKWWLNGEIPRYRVKTKKHIVGLWFRPHWNVLIEFDNSPEDQIKRKNRSKITCSIGKFRQIDEWILQTWWALQ